MSRVRLFLVSAALLVGVSTAQATTFGLESSIGAMPTFSISSGGNTATFSSNAGNGFVVQDTTGFYSFDTALLDQNYFGSDSLTVSFSSPIDGILVIPFGIVDAFGTTDYLTVSASNGQTASYLGTPNSLVLAEPEGIAKFVLNSPVSSVVLTGTNAFAIGDISAVTPEPGSFLLLATGLAGMALRRRP